MDPFAGLDAAQTGWDDGDDWDRSEADESETEQEPPSKLVKQPTIMVTYQMRGFDREYEMGRALGEPGSFGAAYECWKKDDDEQTLRCVKIINKARFYMVTQEKERTKVFETLKREIGLLKQLKHKNIVKLYDVFEDRNTIYLVMEHLPGGELFDRITEIEGYSENDAANILHQILEALLYMQSNDPPILHLDLKPENILFTRKNSDEIKLIDFGMARMAPRFAKLKERVGTSAYMAPEVYKGEYGKPADMWSVGIILFCMIFGFSPFYPTTENIEFMDKQIEDKVLNHGFLDEIKEGQGPWFPKDMPISDDLRKLIAGMLRTDVRKRLTVKQSLDSKWLDTQLSDETNHTIPLSVIQGLKEFNRQCKFKVAVSKMFADMIDPSHLERVEAFFHTLDENNDGIISSNEFINGMKQHYHTKLSDEKLEELFKNADIDGNQGIDLEELITVASHQALIDEDERLFGVFTDLDSNGDGLVSEEELINAARKHKKNRWANRVKTIFIKSATHQDRPKNNNDASEYNYEDFLRLIHPNFEKDMSLEEWANKASAVQTRVRASTFDIDIRTPSSEPLWKQTINKNQNQTRSMRIVVDHLDQKDSTLNVFGSSPSTPSRKRSSRKMDLTSEEMKEYQQLKQEKQFWIQEKSRYENEILELKSHLGQVREKYQSIIDKMSEQNKQQTEMASILKKIRDENDMEKQHETKIDKLQDELRGKDSLIQDLYMRLTDKSNKIESLSDQLFDKTRENDGLQTLLEDAIHSKMESLQRMELCYNQFYLNLRVRN